MNRFGDIIAAGVSLVGVILFLILIGTVIVEFIKVLF